MCDGKYERDPKLGARFRYVTYDRKTASYLLRGRYRRIGGKNCIYCGFKAQTGDHVPALFLGYINGMVKGVIVSSCYDCNKYLGSLPSTCLKERASNLYNAYTEEIIDLEKLESNSAEEPQTREKIDSYKLKAERCKQRTIAINCNLIVGSAALFSENGDCGGEITSYNSFEPLLSNANRRHYSKEEI